MIAHGLAANCERTKPLDEVDLIVVHHCSLARLAVGNPDPIEDIDLTGIELIKRFRDPGLGTGGRRPYHAGIRLNGSVEQMIPLDQQGAHCKGYNRCSFGVACFGESGTPTRAQTEALTRVIVSLVLLTRARAPVVRHDSLPGVAKICPGRGYDVPAIEKAALQRMPPGWLQWSTHRILQLLQAEGWLISANLTQG